MSLYVLSGVVVVDGATATSHAFESSCEPCDYGRATGFATVAERMEILRLAQTNSRPDYLPFSLPPLQRFRCTMGCDFAVIVGTRIVLQEADVHFWNKLNIFNTEATFQPPMGCLKAVAELNVAYMLATAATFQPPTGWLKDVAEEKASTVCYVHQRLTKWHVQSPLHRSRSRGVAGDSPPLIPTSAMAR